MRKPAVYHILALLLLTILPAAAQGFSPASLAVPSTFRYTGSGSSTIGPFTNDDEAVSFISASTFGHPDTPDVSGTYTYLKNGPNTARLIITGTFSDPPTTRTFSETINATFTSVRDGTFTSTGSWSESGGGGTYTKVSGTFTYAVAIGSVTMAYRELKVIRDGKEMPILLGDPIYLGDVMVTGSRSFAKIVLNDRSQFNIGGDSMMKIEKYVEPELGVVTLFIKLLRGVVRDMVIGERTKEGFILYTNGTVIGVRGTEFSVGIAEEGGQATTTVEVVSGIVDLTDLRTGITYEVLAGGSKSVIAPISDPIITVNVPGGGGSIWIDGVEITAFPHSFSARPGTEIELEASADDDREFRGWWGNVEIDSEEWTLMVTGDEVWNCEFTLEPDEVEELFANAMAAAGLDGVSAEAAAVPFQDGVPNLLKWAFNMDLAGADVRSLIQGDHGLPAYSVAHLGGASSFNLTYLRRTDGAVVYRPMISADLSFWEPLSAVETIVPVSTLWERVTVSVPVEPGTLKGGYVRVGVSLP